VVVPVQGVPAREYCVPQENLAARPIEKCVGAPTPVTVMVLQ
jgi:hypothetical protein